MNDELYTRLQKLFSDEIQGGICDEFMGIVDKFIDDGDLSQEEWNKYEFEISAMFDNNWFTCEGCSWTLPSSEMEGDWHCQDCVEE